MRYDAKLSHIEYLQVTDSETCKIFCGSDQEWYSTSRSCCGTSLHFEPVTLTDQDQPEDINGISVLMDEATRAWTGTVTIDEEYGGLTLHDSAASCCG